MMRIQSRLSALLGVLTLVAAHAMAARAVEGSADECARKMQSFVGNLDYVMSLEQEDVYPLLNIVKKYFPTQGCRVDDVLALAKQSKFFWGLVEQYTVYTVSFRNGDYIASFGLEKSSGNITLPTAYVRYR